MPEKFENAFDPTHELGKEAVVMRMNLVNELVEVVLVPLAEVNKGLDSLVRIR